MKSKRASQKKKNVNSLWLAGLAVMAVLALAVIFFTRQSGETPTGEAFPAEISVAQALEKRSAGAFILDVRQPDEWDEYHMPGATLIPLNELAGRTDEVPKDREVVVVCRSGNRSATGRDILKEAGFAEVASMAGGMSEWRSAGYPTVTGP